MADKLQTPFEAFGVECHAGWKGLYEPLQELCRLHGYEVVQIKEKFGGLRFYVTDGDGTLDTLISVIEDASFAVCEDCGTTRHEWDPITKRMKSIVTTSSSPSRNWIRSLCPPCREKWDTAAL